MLKSITLHSFNTVCICSNWILQLLLEIIGDKQFSQDGWLQSLHTLTDTPAPAGEFEFEWVSRRLALEDPQTPHGAQPFKRTSRETRSGPVLASLEWPGEWLDLESLLNCINEAVSQNISVKAVLFLLNDAWLQSQTCVSGRGSFECWRDSAGSSRESSVSHSLKTQVC